MYVVVITLTVIVALLLIGVVLIQKSKGGGLSSQFGGANQVMGVRRTSRKTAGVRSVRHPETAVELFHAEMFYSSSP